MTDNQVKLIIGSLLHDIGKIVYRTGDGRNHSESGYLFLKEKGMNDSSILECVRYHHGKNLRSAKVRPDSPAYITYYADNIAAAADRRERDTVENGFDKQVPLSSVFNILNGNNGRSHYRQYVLDGTGTINYPTEEPVRMDESFYKKIEANIADNLKGIRYDTDYVNSLLSILEGNCSYIPSSTARKELADISLYDHVKITAAVAQAVQIYLEEKGCSDYRNVLFEKADQSYKEKMFLLYSIDISGIQKFIYTITSSGALKGLRARSFYLEILMEHMIDQILSACNLSRASLIYSGGGHCYMLLPNTPECRQQVEKIEKQTNEWFLKNFDIALYVAGGFAECSANDLKNEPQGSYSALYMEMSKQISRKKVHRYTPAQLIALNSRKHKEERECVICKRTGKLNEKNQCSLCASLEKFSGKILYESYFCVLSQPDPEGLPLPGDCYLYAMSEKELKTAMESPVYIRSYTKNRIYTGKQVTTKLWVGDYTTGNTFEEYASLAKGIDRIAVLRADVDNLGKAFVSGFTRPGGDSKYVSLSRTAAFSRQMSIFFKYHINSILRDGKADYFDHNGERKVTIVYSGGDDVFLAGAWDEVISAFIDIKNAFERFTQGTLTISGGVGMYASKYPLNMMAKETGNLEEYSKNRAGKNAITVFDENGSYPWNVFLGDVLEEKYRIISRFFSQSEERGKALLYHLLDLMRDSEEKIQIARFIYTLSRLEPVPDSSSEQISEYRVFANEMYKWMKDPVERRKAITAMYLYVYYSREEEEE